MGIEAITSNVVVHGFVPQFLERCFAAFANWVKLPVPFAGAFFIDLVIVLR